MATNWTLIAVVFFPPIIPFAVALYLFLTGRAFQNAEPMTVFWIFVLSPYLYLLAAGIWSTPFVWLAIAFGPEILPGR